MSPSLATYLIPGVLSPDSIPYNGSLVVQLLSQAGRPLYAPSDLMVDLKSSDSSIASVSLSVSVRKGDNYGLATIQTTFRAGQVVVTALAGGYTPSRLAVDSRGQVASFLFLLRDRKSTRLNSSHIQKSRMPSSA